MDRAGTHAAEFSGVMVIRLMTLLQSHVTAELILLLPTPLDLALGRHILSKQLQLVNLDPRNLLKREI